MQPKPLNIQNTPLFFWLVMKAAILILMAEWKEATYEIKL